MADIQQRLFEWNDGHHYLKCVAYNETNDKVTFILQTEDKAYNATIVLNQFVDAMPDVHITIGSTIIDLTNTPSIGYILRRVEREVAKKISDTLFANFKHNSEEIINKFDAVKMQLTEEIKQNMPNMAPLFKQLTGPVADRNECLKMLLRMFNDTTEYYNSTQVKVTLINNNLYNWSVLVEDIPDSTKVKTTVTLQLIFPESYPNHPPIVLLLSPEFTDLFNERISKMDMIQLEMWKKDRTIISIINKARQLITKHAVVRTGKPLFDPTKYNQLLQLIRHICATIGTNHPFQELDTDKYERCTPDEFDTRLYEMFAQVTILLDSLVEYLLNNNNTNTNTNTNNDEIPDRIQLIHTLNTTFFPHIIAISLKLFELIVARAPKILTSIIKLIQILVNIDAGSILTRMINGRSIQTRLNEIDLTKYTNDTDIIEAVQTITNNVNKVCAVFKPDSYAYTVYKVAMFRYKVVYTPFTKYLLMNKVDADSTILPEKSKLDSDLEELETDLIDETIFVQVNTDNKRCLRAMIMGRAGTPYDSGCYIFDIYVPNDYPKTFPTVMHVNNCGFHHNAKLIKTGGTVIFDEAKLNSITDILLYIQDEILIEDPFTLENYTPEKPTQSYQSYNPYDAYMRDYTNNYNWAHNTYSSLTNLQPKELSTIYTRYIRLYNITSLNMMLSDPENYPGLYDVLKKHLQLFKPYLVDLYNQWEREHVFTEKGTHHTEKLLPFAFKELMVKLLNKID